LALYGQASWVFRGYGNEASLLNNGSIVYSGEESYIPYLEQNSTKYFKLTEI
jgi:hypothetical protein